MKLAIAIIAFGLVLLGWGCARAEWQIHEWTGATWEPAITPKGWRAAILIEKSACEIDLASLANMKPAGTRLQCREVRLPKIVW